MPQAKTRTAKTLPLALLLELRPAVRDRKLLVALAGGDKVVGTHAQVGAHFDLSGNTIKQSWAPQGMPTTDDGRYSLIDVLIWRLGYLDERESRRTYAGLSGDQLKRQLAEEELRKLQLQADRLQREEQQAMGNLIDRNDAVSGLRAYSAALAEHLESLPDQVAPMLPIETASEIVEEMRGGIRRYLEQFRNKSARAIMQEHG